ncbi:MAG: peptidylprolyl isomerase [Tibeticola sp.]|nr:peptidylprolyl isomerase [Tibeticola sp.]
MTEASLPPLPHARRLPALSQALTALLCVGLLAPTLGTAQGLRLKPGTSASTLAPAAAAATLPPAVRGPQPADFIVAVVNDEPITNREVQRAVEQLQAQLAARGGPQPDRATLEREVLERLISDRAHLQLAAEQGIKVDDTAVDQAEQNVARQNGLSVEQLHRELERRGVSLREFRENLRRQIILTRLREREVASRLQVTEADVDEFIASLQAAQDGAPELVNLGHILVAVPEQASPQQVEALRQRALELAQRARQGEDFAALARQFSQSPEGRESGGMLGLRPLDRYPELFVEAIRGAAPGAVVGPIRSGAGFHILKVLERRVPDALPTQVTQTHARHILLRPGPKLSEAQARERLAELRARVLRGQADFAALAREYSQDGSAREGGDLGWASPGQFVPEFEEALAQLAPGEISPPVVSRFGVHLIQLLERREKTLTPQEQREIARNLAREKKLEEAYERWARDVRARAYVELREPPQAP